MSGGVTRIASDGDGGKFSTTTTTKGGCKQPTLTLLDRGGSNPNNKRSRGAETSPEQPSEEQQPPVDRTTHTDEQVEVIKVFLKSRQPREVKMLTDEVSQIQEVRYCLKTLREQMAARQNNNNNRYPANGFRVPLPNKPPVVTNGNTIPTKTDALVSDSEEESSKLREATRRLYAQLQEAERRHQEDRQRLQVENSESQRRLEEQSERLQRAEQRAEERAQRSEELQRLLGSMEAESAALRSRVVAGEAELQQLRRGTDPGEDGRSEVLEKELARLKEKIHHLDDMLKSQQRKVRHMIEQLQNSRTIIQERDRVIMDLEEKVAFLEAENREMHHHMEFMMGGQEPPPEALTENKPQIIYSKPLTPSTHSNKALPFIKVIEIKS